MTPFSRSSASLQRSWLFIPGVSPSAHESALCAPCDVIVADLEEMTALRDRPLARDLIVGLITSAHACGAYAAVRINRMEEDGRADLEGIMAGKPDAVFLPHAETCEQLLGLDAVLAELERRHDIPLGSTTIVPTIESARGLVRLGALLACTPRIRACMLAVEDLAASLGARRTPEGNELLYARSRFLLEVRAAGCLPIDLPCTYTSSEALAYDLNISSNLGFDAKCVVFLSHIESIHRAFTPSLADVEAARNLLLMQATQNGDKKDISSAWVDYPEANNAKRTLARYALCERATPRASV